MPHENAIELERGLGTVADYPHVLSFAIRTLRQVGGNRSRSVSARSCLDGDLELESVDLIEFQVAMEEAYDVQLDAVTMVELNSLDRIVRYVVEAIRAAHLLGTRPE